MSSNIEVSLKCNGQTYEHLQISIVSIFWNESERTIIEDNSSHFYLIMIDSGF